MDKIKIMNSTEGYLTIVVILISLFFALTTDNFFNLRNLLDLMESYAVTGIFALGLFVVLVTGGIDISFAAIASVVQYLMVTMLMSMGLESALFGILLTCLMGALIGMLNAVFIYYFNIVSIIVTISMQSVLFGLLMFFTNGHSIYDLPDWLIRYREVLPFSIGGQNYQLGLPLAVLLLVTLVSWILLNKTHLGRQLFAVGGSQESARRVGIRVGLLHLFAYGYLGVAAALAGLTQVHRMGEIVPNALVGTELDVLAAVVLGGASLMGGKGSIYGTLMGVFLIAVLKNGLNLYGVSSYFLDIVLGLVIVVAIVATHYRKRKETNVGFA